MAWMSLGWNEIECVKSIRESQSSHWCMLTVIVMIYKPFEYIISAIFTKAMIHLHANTGQSVPCGIFKYLLEAQCLNVAVAHVLLKLGWTSEVMIDWIKEKFFWTLKWKLHCQSLEPEKLMPESNYWYRKTSRISRTKSKSLNVSCILLQLSSLNLLKPGVKFRMKM